MNAARRARQKARKRMRWTDAEPPELVMVPGLGQGGISAQSGEPWLPTSPGTQMRWEYRRPPRWRRLLGRARLLLWGLR